VDYLKKEDFDEFKKEILKIIESKDVSNKDVETKDDDSNKVHPEVQKILDDALILGE